MPWFQLTVELDADRADDVSAFLHEVGSAGVELREAGVKPIPGQRAAGEGRALLIAYFPALESAAEARAFLESQPGVELGQPTEVVEEDWSETWKAQIRPVTTARLWVGPPWLQDQAPELTHVVIEPGMAFRHGQSPDDPLLPGVRRSGHGGPPRGPRARRRDGLGRPGHRRRPAGRSDGGWGRR